MKKLLLGLVSLLLVSCSLIRPAKDPCKAEWFGEINEGFYKIVRADIKTAKEASCAKLSVDLMSPGGSVVDVLAVLTEIRAGKKQFVIEFHARGIIASGATFVLGMGSVGHRFVAENTFVLVHGLQTGSMFVMQCTDAVVEPVTEQEKTIAALSEIMAAEYAKATGRSFEEVSEWLWCGHELAGDGRLLVYLNLADHLE